MFHNKIVRVLLGNFGIISENYNIVEDIPHFRWPSISLIEENIM